MHARAIALIGITFMLALPAPATADPPRSPADASVVARLKPQPIDVGSADHEVLGAADCLDHSSGAEPHVPITIASDADLASPAAGVRSGTGTPESPYVISGWLFAGQGDIALEGLGHAIRLAGTTKHVVIRDNVILAAGYPQGLDVGIHVSSPNVTIEENTVCATVYDGIFAEGAPGVIIEDNVIADARAGVWALDSPDARVISNDVETSLFGIAVDSSPGSLIEDNTVRTLGDPSVGTAGIVSNHSDGVRIADNDVTGPGTTTDDQGINVYSSTGPVLIDNAVAGVGSFGIVVGYAYDALIENNRAVGNGLAGLLLWDDWVVGGNVVRGGDYSGNGAFGASLVAWVRSGVIVLDSDANVLEGVKATGNLYHGVYVIGSDSIDTPGPDRIYDTVVRNANASGNEYGAGIGTESDERTSIRDSRVAGNGGGGISLLASGATVEGNEITSNGGAGVQVSGGGDQGGTTVRNNDIDSNQRGVHLRHAHDAVLTGNAIDHNRYGFGIDGRTADHFRNRIDASNSVNGRAVHVIEGATGELDAAALDPAYLALLLPADLDVRGLRTAGQVQGLTIFGGRNVRVHAPRLTDNEVGIDVIRSENVTISDGTFNDNATGVRPLGDTTATAITGSSFTGGDVGVDVQWLNEIPVIGFGQPDGTAILDNRFEGVRRTAMDVSGPNTSISGNTILGPSDTALRIESGPTTIEDNTIRGPGDRGIDVVANATTIRENLISGFQHGISNRYGESTAVEDSLIRGNGTGYFSTGGADGSALRRNVIADNQRGVVIQGEVWDMVVDCNRIVGNGDEGIRTYILTFRTQITNNAIEGNGTGLRVDSTLGSITGNRISGNAIGLLYDRVASLPSFPATGNDIVGNQRWGATTLAAGNDTLVGVGTAAAESITGNWWGDPNGPFAQTNRLGRGDQVSDQLNYRNWLTGPADAGACADALPEGPR